MDQTILMNCATVAAMLLLALLTFAVLLDVRRLDSHIMRLLAPTEYVRPVYPPLRQGQCTEEARAWYAQRQAPAVDESFGKHRPVEVTRDSESTPVSPVDPLVLAEMRAEHRTQMEVPVYRGQMPALGEDEERGMWTRGKR